jgi:acyl carrier protein
MSVPLAHERKLRSAARQTASVLGVGHYLPGEVVPNDPIVENAERHTRNENAEHTRTNRTEGGTRMSATATTDAVEKTIIDALAQFGVEPAAISLESTFEELDVDSLDLTEIAQIIEDDYGVQLKGEDMKNIKTVGDAIDLVVSKAG